MRIGLIGEDPSDTDAVQNLLKRKYTAVQFTAVLSNLKGSKLDSPKFEKLFKAKVNNLKKNCNIIIYIRDLDGPASNSTLKAKRIDWFKKLDKLSDSTGILMLNVEELEALILADPDTFNKLYKSNIKDQNPESRNNPKEFLKSGTKKGKRKFKESDNPEIFEKIDFQKVKQKAKHFRLFIEELEKEINNK